MVERHSFVAVSPGVTVDVALTRALKRGEETSRVVLLRLTGAGLVFLQAAESSIEMKLEPGEELEVPVASVVCFEATIEYEIRLARIGGRLARQPGVEWLAALTGPGRVRLAVAAPPAP